jgi:hypothetical protein
MPPKDWTNPMFLKGMQSAMALFEEQATLAHQEAAKAAPAAKTK